MIDYERFFDTERKRRTLFILTGILFSIGISFTYIQSANILLNLSSYEDIFAMLKNGDVETSYIARVVLSCISMPSFNLFSFLKALFYNLHIMDVLYMCMIFIWLSARNLKDYRHIIYKLFVMYIMMMMGIGGIALIATSASSLMDVVYSLYKIAYIIWFIEILIIMMLFHYGKKVWKEYRIALLYRAVELKENEFPQDNYIKFRIFQSKDIEILKHWLHKDRISRWVDTDFLISCTDEASNVYRYILEVQDTVIGYCEYQMRNKQDTYNIQLFIGEEAYLMKGYGSQMLRFLIDKISVLPNASYISASCDVHNKLYVHMLKAANFVYDDHSKAFLYKIE